jgi:predicted porin
MRHDSTSLTLLALALLTLLSAPSWAQPAQIYGRFHLSTDYLNGHSTDEGFTLSSNSSRLGFRGDSQVSDAIKVIWQVEALIRAENNSPISTDRNTYVGMTGNWGLFRAGRFDSPLKELHSRINLFGDQIGDARNILRADAADGDSSTNDTHWWDERLANSLAYRTPTWKHLSANLQYSTNQSSGAASSSEEASWGASVHWQYKGLWIAFAHEDSTKVIGAALTQRSANRLASSVDVGNLRLTALYQQASDPDIDAWGIGARFQTGERFAVKTHFYRLDAKGRQFDAEQFAVGIDFQFARELMFYLNYAQLLNGESINRNPWTQARSDALTTGNGDNPDAVSAGMVYRF